MTCYSFHSDCVYYSNMRPEQYRAWCSKLNRMIRARDCTDCGWYLMKLHAGTVGEQGRKDLEAKLREEKK